MSTENKHTITDLSQMQSLPLDIKVRMTMTRIKGWVNEYGEDGVYISFSGGKDSTVLMDIIRNEMGLDIPAVFVDVPTQFPELKEFSKTFDNIEIIKPTMSFMQVCETYGFPLMSKDVARQVSDVRKHGTNCYAYRLFDGSMNESWYNKERYKFLINAPFDISNKCCHYFKKEPLHKYTKSTGRKPITAQMAEESTQRKIQWIKNGCNGFDMKAPISNPMSFWTEQDVLKYIKNKNIKICSVYGNVVDDGDKLKTTGCDRTGCMLCGFGCQQKKDDRFLQLKKSHPKMYGLLDIIKNNGMTFREAIEWTNEHGNFNIKL